MKPEAVLEAKPTAKSKPTKPIVTSKDNGSNMIALCGACILGSLQYVLNSRTLLAPEILMVPVQNLYVHNLVLDALLQIH